MRNLERNKSCFLFDFGSVSVRFLFGYKLTLSQTCQLIGKQSCRRDDSARKFKTVVKSMCKVAYSRLSDSPRYRVGERGGGILKFS